MSDILSAALALAASGKPVLPCWNTPDDEDKHKTPMVKRGFHAATTDPATIKRWWGRSPNALIGMRTGAASGIAVLDLDVKKGKNGYAAVPDWETRSPVIVKTLSGGAHLYFNTDGAIPTRVEKIAKGVDTKGEGGYVIVPPSPGYSWVNGHDLSALPPFPADLAALLQDDEDYGPHTSAAEFTAPLFQIAAAVEAIPNDDIDNYLSWDEWNRIGMAIWMASDGTKEGFDIFDKLSQKSGKYKIRTTRKRWQSYFRSPPTSIGFGTLHFLATKADPDWERRLEDQVEQRLWHSDVDPDWNAKFFELLGEQADNDKPDVSVLVEPAAADGSPVDEPPLDQGEPKTEPKPEPKTEPPSGAKQETKPTAIEPDAGALIISSRKFIADFKPPDYLIEGLLQRRFLYSMTAMTNTGKTTVALRLAAHVALGLPLGDKEIEQGKVLFFAGENPDDIRMRWIKLCEEMKIDKETDQVFWVAGVYSIKKLRRVIDTQTTKCGPFALIVIDSAAAYFEGNDENDNVQLGNYARMLRTLVEIYGGPTIIVLCHPIKNATPDSLLPRGGGAFVNEVDGNLVLKTVSEAPKVVDLHWHGKFRGPDFSPIPFMITPGKSERIKDSKGREIWTVTARPLSASEKAATEERGQQNQDKLLSAMKAHEGAPLIELARHCGWYYKNGDPNKSLVERMMHDLEARRLVKKDGGHWKLTKAGLAVDTESL